MENTNGCLGVIEYLKCQIERVSGRDFAEKVAEITSADANTYSINQQTVRMDITLQLLMMGVDNEDILNLLESQKEHIAIYLLRSDYQKFFKKGEVK